MNNAETVEKKIKNKTFFIPALGRPEGQFGQGIIALIGLHRQKKLTKRPP